MPIRRLHHPGFTVAETLVAIVLIGLVLGGLEGSAAKTVQQLRDDNSESIAAHLLQARTESLLAGACTPSTGVDSSHSVVTTWHATSDGNLLQIDQTVRYPTAFGNHTETFQTFGGCP